MVTVRGARFKHVEWVKFGKIRSSKVRVRSGQKLRVRVPAGTGTVKVWVRTRAGLSNKTTAFSYLSHPGGWTSIAAGLDSTCGIDGKRRAWCWGWNFAGGLGDGTRHDSTVPVRVATKGVSGRAWAQIDTDGGHSCGLRDNGTLWCWGHNSWGQLGNGTTTRRLTPSRVRSKGLSGGRWAGVAVGMTHGCGIRDDGTAWCWGDKRKGQLGNGAHGGGPGITRPVRVDTSTVTGTRWNALTTGRYRTCGLRDDGSAWCWGEGPLGDGAPPDDIDKATPSRVVTTGVSGSKWITIATGDETCGLRDDGSAWCWGDGPLGDGTNDASAVPMQVGTAGVSGSRWTSIKVGGSHICGLRDDGSAWCWGNRTARQLGDGLRGAGQGRAKKSPVRVVTPGVSGRGWTVITTGESHTCALRDNTTAWCWGAGYYGQAGNGSNGRRVPVPTQVR